MTALQPAMGLEEWKRLPVENGLAPYAAGSEALGVAAQAEREEYMRRVPLKALRSYVPSDGS
jgi:hypothetical protein